jgi:hypothetical protein
MKLKEQKEMNKRRALLLTATLFLGGFSLMVSVPTFARAVMPTATAKRGCQRDNLADGNEQQRVPPANFDRAMDNSNLMGPLKRTDSITSWPIIENSGRSA